jgi:hypothetical protein
MFRFFDGGFEKRRNAAGRGPKKVCSRRLCFFMTPPGSDFRFVSAGMIRFLAYWPDPSGKRRGAVIVSSFLK